MTRSRLFALLILGAALLVSCCATETETRKSAQQQVARAPESPASPAQPCLDLNKATAEELTRLPGVGEVIARRIVDYRKQHGPLRRPQEIIIVEGFGERKYRAIAELVCVE
jgi:competence ComEA-like helix-hairpin-helix protein